MSSIETHRRGRPRRQLFFASLGRRPRRRMVVHLGLILLLFPIFLTASDAEMLHRLVLFSAPIAPFDFPHLERAARQLNAHEDLMCVACLWSNLESAAPSHFIYFSPTVHSFPMTFPQVARLRPAQEPRSTSERAPPRLHL